MDKRGVSAIIATVLLVLITIVAAGVIYGAVMPMIKGNIEKSNLCNDAGIEIDQESGYTCYNSATGDIQVSIKRGEKDVDLAGVQIQVSGGGKSKTVDISNISSTGVTEYGGNSNSLGSIYLMNYSYNSYKDYYQQKNPNGCGGVGSTINCGYYPCSEIDACKTVYPATQAAKFKKQTCSTGYNSYLNEIECLKSATASSVSLPGKNELITYVINSSMIGITTPEKVAAAPMVKIGGSKSQSCPLSNPVTINEC